jgi:hypothetical protein
MIYPALTYTELGCGIFLVFASSYSILKIRQGSKSKFAYTLMSFTLLDAAQCFGDFFINTFLQKI